MARKKKIEKKGFLLLDKKSKTYSEFSDKKALVEKLGKIIAGGKNPSEYGIVPNKALSFDLAYTISIKERAPRRKKITRKPRKPRAKVIAKPSKKATRKTARKSIHKPVETPSENTK